MSKEMIQVGKRIKFPEFNYFWKIRAVDDRYAICTAYGGYTIIDLKHDIRGPGISWSLGHRTDEEIQNSMLALNGNHPDGIEQEISTRYGVKLYIEEIK